MLQRFNSNICQGKLPGGVKSQKYCCLAIGSRDRAVSVWLTSLKRPLIVIRELFTHSVMDASWSPCGFHLAACSWDGTVAFITFSTQELGQPLNEQQKVAFILQLFFSLDNLSFSTPRETSL